MFSSWSGSPQKYFRVESRQKIKPKKEGGLSKTPNTPYTTVGQLWLLVLGEIVLVLAEV